MKMIKETEAATLKTRGLVLASHRNGCLLAPAQNNSVAASKTGTFMAREVASASFVDP
jgi:hypothetical protein